MIDIRQAEITIAEALKAYLQVEVICANQTAPIPDYPFVSYTIITPLIANNGTWSEYEDGTKRKEVQQTWSFSVQADNDTQSKKLAILAHDFFDEVGTVHLNDNGVIVQHLGNVTNRDSFISTGYEYKNGFDVVFTFMSEIIPSEEALKNVIESASMAYDNEVKAERTIDNLNIKLEQRLDGDLDTENTLENNVKQAISDFDEIEKALEESGIQVPEGADTKDFAELVRELGNSIGSVTLTKYTKDDVKGGDS